MCVCVWVWVSQGCVRLRLAQTDNNLKNVSLTSQVSQTEKVVLFVP